MASIAEANSLFEIDMELDGLLEEIQEQVESEREPSEDLVARFQQFCAAHGEKVDRIGGFVRMMEAREQLCRSEAARLGDRARAAANKVERTKNMVLYYLLSRDLKKIEGYTIHLGDVYYVGDDQEVKENFLGTAANQYTPVYFPKGSVGTLTMLGNHEMYGGGDPYFGEMLAYCSPNLGHPQQTSFFCLETSQWRIIGLDTGYNSVGTPVLGSIPIIKKISWFGANCALQDELLSWLGTNVNPQQNKKPTLLLSHHQYFTAYGDEAFGRPAEQLKEFFAGQEVVWIWGHEHRLAIYDKFSPDLALRMRIS